MDKRETAEEKWVLLSWRKAEVTCSSCIGELHVSGKRKKEKLSLTLWCFDAEGLGWNPL